MEREAEGPRARRGAVTWLARHQRESARLRHAHRIAERLRASDAQIASPTTGPTVFGTHPSEGATYRAKFSTSDKL